MVLFHKNHILLILMPKNDRKRPYYPILNLVISNLHRQLLKNIVKCYCLGSKDDLGLSL